MAKNILLLEPKLAASQQLAKHLERHPEQTVYSVKTMREACAVVTEQTIDLALLPVTRNDTLVYSLRMLQPDIAIILIAASADQIVPERQRQVVRGVIDRRALLEQADQEDYLVADPVMLEPLFRSFTPDDPLTPKLRQPAPLNPDHFSEIARELLKTPQIQFVVFLQEQEIIGYHTSDNTEQLSAAAAVVKERINDGEGPPPAQIEFIDPKEAAAAALFPDDTLMLYTRPFGSYMMTIGAHAQTPVSLLRKLIKQIQLRYVSGQNFIASPSSAALKIEDEEGALASYVLVWRPQIALNAENRLALDKILPAIALAEGFVLQDIILNERFVHVVVSCPPQRNSAWLAQTLKHNSEIALQKKIGYAVPIWSKGYYAKRSGNPLSAAELNRYLMLKP